MRFISIRHYSLIGLLPVFTASVHAAADTRAADTVLDDVQVTASAPQSNLNVGYQALTNSSAVKTDTPLIDLPQSLTVITPELIKDQNIRSVSEAVRYTPGVSVAQGEGNRDQIVIRGSSSTGDLFVDGVRDDVQYYRDMYNIERIDILKGPNAMVFGRGGSGGLVNRATKQADWSNHHEADVQFGSFDQYRLVGDFDQALNDSVAIRLTSLWDSSGSFRDGVDTRRWAINPTMTWKASDQTKITLGYEHFFDFRTADRGISSLAGRPVNTGINKFFGDPDRSYSQAEVDAYSLVVDHDFGDGVTIRNRTRYASYDKSYQNIFPGAVNAAATQVAISAYNDATQRENFFNQTDLTFDLNTGPFKHHLLTGAEFGMQNTGNYRMSGFFSDVGANVSSVNVALSNPLYKAPINFRHIASDANNVGQATIFAGYLQDQMQITSQLQAVFGVRYDRFEMDFRNNNNADRFIRYDDLVSPRGGLIYKPFGENFSMYANYSVAYVPRAGDQLGSLTVTNATLKPEEYHNYELGAKWDITPGFSTTLAFFQLDRLNALATDPNNAALSFLVDGQRTQGIEWGWSGDLTERWHVMGGYAYQDAQITKTLSASAPAGAQVALVPEHSFSLWNRFDVTKEFGVGLGTLYRSKIYTSNDNRVMLPSYVRFDAAAYYKISKNIELQLNVENLLDKTYYATAHNNTNISPGSPIAVTGGVRMQF